MSKKKFYFMALTTVAFAKAEGEAVQQMSVNVSFGSDVPFINQDTLGYISESALTTVANNVGSDSLIVSDVMMQNIFPLGEMSDTEWLGSRAAQAQAAAASAAEPEGKADPVEETECETCKVD